MKNITIVSACDRNFLWGAYLLAANQDTHNIAVFRIDGETGRLTPTGQSIEVGMPVCVQFLPIK